MNIIFLPVDSTPMSLEEAFAYFRLALVALALINVIWIPLAVYKLKTGIYDFKTETLSSLYLFGCFTNLGAVVFVAIYAAFEFTEWLW